MRVVLAGTPEVAVPSLDALLASPHDVVAVLTRTDARAGRGRRESLSPVKARALAEGLPVLQPRRPGDPEALAALRELAPDCVPVVAYGALVPPSALAVPRHGWVNLHFSLLPAWRGATPVQHALIAGDEVTGATTFRLEEGLDTGPVYGTLTEAVRPDDTAGSLLARLAGAGAALLLATLDGIAAGRLQPVAQPADGVSLAPRLGVDDARVDWSAPAIAVDRRVRACTPAPGAWTTWRGDRLRLAPVQPLTPPPAFPLPGDHGIPPPLRPGELRIDREGVTVGTASHPVRLGSVRPAGKRDMPAVDWARGARPAPGEAFE